MLALTIILPLIGFVLLAFSRGRWSCLLYTSYGEFKTVRDDLHRLWKVKSCVDTAARFNERTEEMCIRDSIGTLINQTAHMNRQSAAVHIVSLFAEQVKQLGITHGYKAVSYTHLQSCFGIDKL